MDNIEKLIHDEKKQAIYEEECCENIFVHDQMIEYALIRKKNSLYRSLESLKSKSNELL